ncbi:GNAT family N-acetyltransferase [Granulicatella seriolae]|uniref:GNAT family N-acetyltransferase n=1 Tax=Granulicatella seriolae TaxID=2967226 RepID=A0ABT1WPY6_9LACT|nr:GNAT family N-acetyltransferase [Granulicatella seriolae]
MLDISKLSEKYIVKKLTQEDFELVYNLQKGNPLYFEYCPPNPSLQGVLNDMKALPPTKEYKDKYYIGFFEEENLIAVIDLIAEFPNKDTMYIGFFMVGNEYSGKNIGSMIIKTCLKEFQAQGFSFVRLGYMKGNPQSKAF